MSMFNIHNNPIFIKQEINNGLLKTTNAMPQKDSTSDNQSSFSADRRAYNRSWTINPKMNVLNPPHFGIAGMNNGSRRLPTVFDGTHTQKQKQWYGNRDASEVTRKSRVGSVGGGSSNINGTSFSFESHSNVNTVNQALRRVRSGGAVAPEKKNHNVQNAYSPSPKNIPLVPALTSILG
jgi:hypothetical protein